MVVAWRWSQAELSKTPVTKGVTTVGCFPLTTDTTLSPSPHPHNHLHPHLPQAPSHQLKLFPPNPFQLTQHPPQPPFTRRRPPPTPKLQTRNPTPAPLWTSALLQGDRNPPEPVIGIVGMRNTNMLVGARGVQELTGTPVESNSITLSRPET